MVDNIWWWVFAELFKGDNLRSQYGNSRSRFFPFPVPFPGREFPCGKFRISRRREDHFIYFSHYSFNCKCFGNLVYFFLLAIGIGVACDSQTRYIVSRRFKMHLAHLIMLYKNSAKIRKEKVNKYTISRLFPFWAGTFISRPLFPFSISRTGIAITRDNVWYVSRVRSELLTQLKYGVGVREQLIALGVDRPKIPVGK